MKMLHVNFIFHIFAAEILLIDNNKKQQIKN